MHYAWYQDLKQTLKGTEKIITAFKVRVCKKTAFSKIAERAKLLQNYCRETVKQEW